MSERNGGNSPKSIPFGNATRRDVSYRRVFVMSPRNGFTRFYGNFENRRLLYAFLFGPGKRMTTTTTTMATTPVLELFFSVYGLWHKEIEYPSKYGTMPNGLRPGRMPRRRVDVKAPERVYSIICKSYRMRVGSVRHQTRLHWTTDALNRRSARLSIQKRVDLKRAMTNRSLYSTTSTRFYLKFFYFKLLLQCYFDVLDRTNVWHKSSCADPLMQSKNQPVYNRVWKIKMMEWSVKTKKHFFYALSFRRWA